MRFGLGAMVNERTLPIQVVATEIEARDFDGIWIGEHSHMPVATKHKYAKSAELPDLYKRFFDPWITLAAAAACTNKIRLGTAVCLIAEHNPIFLAKSIATLDYISGGRVDIGAGYGWNPLELENNGVDFKRRRDVFRENVLAMKALWTQETASFEGEFVRFSESWSFPKPVQKPHPPLYIGAQPGPRTFSHIATLSDGWMPDRTWLGEDFGATFDAVRKAAEEAGRDPSALHFTLSGVNGFRRNTIEEFRARLPSPAQIELWRKAGIERLIFGVPLDDRSFMLRCLDALHALNRAVA